jgi:hypothetical protein
MDRLPWKLPHPPLCQTCLRRHNRYQPCPRYLIPGEEIKTRGDWNETRDGVTKDKILRFLAQDAKRWHGARDIASSLSLCMNTANEQAIRLKFSGLVEMRKERLPSGVIRNEYRVRSADTCPLQRSMNQAGPLRDLAIDGVEIAFGAASCGHQ